MSFPWKISVWMAALCVSVAPVMAQERAVADEDAPLLTCATQALAKAGDAYRQSGRLMDRLPWMTIYHKLEDRIYETLQAKGWSEGEVDELVAEISVSADYINAAVPLETVCGEVDPALWRAG